jgi:hypothetical protein
MRFPLAYGFSLHLPTVLPTPARYDRAMSDPMARNPPMEATPPSAAEFLALFQRVEGWIDGDLLLAEVGGALLAEIAAAGRAREAGDPAAVRRHTARFIRALERLIEGRELDDEVGRPALAAAREILNDGAA